MYVSVVRGYACVYVSVSTFSGIFSSETTGPIQTKFHVEPPCDGVTKVRSNGPGYMTKMAAMPLYDKILKIKLLRNQITDDHETWYAETIAVYDIEVGRCSYLN